LPKTPKADKHLSLRTNSIIFWIFWTKSRRKNQSYEVIAGCSFKEIDELLDIARNHRIDGIITTNLTKKRTNPKIIEKELPTVGGISGKPVQDLSDKMLSYIYKKEKGRFVLIGCGGIFSAADAYRKIRLGASLLQMITGMIFEGPQIMSEINRGLAELLRATVSKT